MPLYEYQCARCGRFEVIRKFSDPPLLACPTCGGEIQKLASAPAIQFKGTGWYITDYARKSTGGEAAGKAGEGTSTSSGSKDGKDGGSGSKDVGKDGGSASKDAGTKAASGGSSTSKGSSGSGEGGGSSTK